MKHRLQIVVILIALVATGLIWLNRGRQASQGHVKLRGVVLISIDTLRADRLGCYGYDKPTSPNMDALAAGAVRFEHVTAPVALTLPSHSTMLTGTIPPWHGVRGNLHFRLGDSNVTVAERLAAAGYRTGGFVSSYVLDQQFGLSQGFDHFGGVLDLTIPSPDEVELPASVTTAKALKWLDEAGDEPFFMFVHYYDPHFPYESPEAFGQRFEDPYDAEIAYVDAHVGQIIDRLKAKGLYDDVLLIVAADHGESLGEHSERFHGFFCYQSTLHVPLIVKPAHDVVPRVVDDMVGLTDITPTILAAAGIESDASLDGRDLLSPIEPTPVYFESLRPTTEGANPIVGLADDRWKYILTSRPELYDLTQDPDELTNAIETAPAQARRLHGQLKETLLARSRQAGDSGISLDAEAVAKLRSLGYVGGPSMTGALLLEINKSKPDPKDVIDVVESNQQVFAFVDQQRWQQAESLANRLMVERPNDPQPHLAMARVKEQAGDLQAAADHYLAAIERINKRLTDSGGMQLTDDRNSTRYNLAVLYEKMQQVENAIAVWQTLLADAPQFLDAHYKFAHLMGRLGRLDESMKHLRVVLELRPDHAQAHYNFANALMRQEKLGEAAKHFEQAIRHGLSNTQTHNNYAIVAARLGRPEIAIQHWQWAIKHDPHGDEAAQIHANMAVALQAVGKPSEGAAAWDRAIESARGKGMHALADQLQQRRDAANPTGAEEHP